jgi:hypothetical protein
LKNYSHTFPDDVDVLLAHAGKNRTILSDAGDSNTVDTINLKLDDEAFDGPPAGPSTTAGENQIIEGTFKPFNYEGPDTFPPGAPNSVSAKSALSGFDGLSARGGWNLFVADDGSGDCGRFVGGWTVQIKAAVPQ